VNNSLDETSHGGNGATPPAEPPESPHDGPAFHRSAPDHDSNGHLNGADSSLNGHRTAPDTPDAADATDDDPKEVEQQFVSVLAAHPHAIRRVCLQAGAPQRSDFTDPIAGCIYGAIHELAARAGLPDEDLTLDRIDQELDQWMLALVGDARILAAQALQALPNLAGYCPLRICGVRLTAENSVELARLLAGQIRAASEARAQASQSKNTKSTGKAAKSQPTVKPQQESDTSDPTSTWPYSIKDGQILFTSRRQVRGEWLETVAPVCDFVAHVAEQITVEDAAPSFLIQGQALRGAAFEFEITAERFADDRALKAECTVAAGAQSPVRKGMSGHLAPAISLLSPDTKKTLRYNRTGWADGKFLIPHREPPNVSIRLPRKLPYSINPDADLSLGIEAFESLLRAQRIEMATVAITMLFTAPLAQPAGWRNERSAIFIAGRTGSFKTTWTQLAMTIYGPLFVCDDLLLKWGEGATRNAIMALATHAHDLPFPIDNYKPTTGGGAKDFVSLMHNILEGGEKDRMNRAAELKETKPVFCWPIVTGEDVPDSDSAALARVLVVPFEWTCGTANPYLTNAQKLSNHLCAVGGAWLTWTESDAGGAVAKRMKELFPSVRDRWAADLRKMRADMANPNRVATNLATSELTWLAMQECPALQTVAREYRKQHAAGLREIGEAMADHTAEALEASRYLNALRELLATERCVLVNRDTSIREDERGRVIGYNDGNGGAYILHKSAQKEVNALLGNGGLGGMSERTLHSQLVSLKAIGARDKDRFTKNIRTANGVQNTLHIKPEALELPDPEESA